MNPEDLQLAELVTFEEGSISLHGRRLVLHPTQAMAQLRKDLVDTLGLPSARRVMTRFGLFWGRANGAALKRTLRWTDSRALLKAAFRFMAMEGVGRATSLEIKQDREGRVVQLDLTIESSAEAEEHLTELGWSDDPACWIIVGYVSGCATVCLGSKFRFIETGCRTQGNAHCVFIGKDPDAWDKEHQSPLSYFETEDIAGKVDALTRELELKSKELSRQSRKLALLVGAMPSFIVKGRSRVMSEVFSLAKRVAGYDTSVLLTGETGTGKEVLARYIHEESPRRKKPFLAINCGALSESLLESELFGHARGAFTGAVKERIGLFEQAARGTVLLDEIGDISPAMQLKILRVLQEREVLRIGENEPRSIDVRVLAATHRDLDEGVRDGSFREDLLYRLKVIEINIPALRERPDDILPLARHIVRKLSTRLGLPDLRLDARLIDALYAHSWPGNVRELENALERAAVLSEGAGLTPENLPPSILSQAAIEFPSPASELKSLGEISMDYIHHVLRHTDGNRTRAAAILKIGPTTLWRKLKSGGEAPPSSDGDLSN
jgi:two-component system, NtrC family, response regulator HydG